MMGLFTRLYLCFHHSLPLAKCMGLPSSYDVQKMMPHVYLRERPPCNNKPFSRSWAVCVTIDHGYGKRGGIL